jgi:hypothetical protein
LKKSDILKNRYEIEIDYRDIENEWLTIVHGETGESIR